MEEHIIALPDLDADSIIEVTSYLTAKGASPVAWGKLNSAEKGWLQVMKAMEECTIEAAITGDYGLALQAFLLNPQVMGGNIAKQVLDEMLVANEKYLPQFAKSSKVNSRGLLIVTNRELKRSDFAPFFL